MASAAYINTISILALSRTLGDFTLEVYSDKTRKKTVTDICNRIIVTSTAALHPYLHDPNIKQYDAKAQRKVLRQLGRVNDLFKSEGEGLTTWIAFNLAQLDDLLSYMKDPDRRKAVEKVIYAVKSLSRYVDRNMDDFRAYERACDLSAAWAQKS